MVSPEQLGVARCAAVPLVHLEHFANLQVKPFITFGLILTLVGHKLLYDGLAELLLGSGCYHVGTLLRRVSYPFEMVHVLHTGYYQVGEIGPLEIVVDDPDLLRVVDGEAL